MLEYSEQPYSRVHVAAEVTDDERPSESGFRQIRQLRSATRRGPGAGRSVLRRSQGWYHGQMSLSAGKLMCPCRNRCSVINRDAVFIRRDILIS